MNAQVGTGWIFGASAQQILPETTGDGSSGTWQVALPTTSPKEEAILVRLPRVMIMLDAEDPVTYVARVADAYHRRALVEKLLQQQFYVDSMPRQYTQQLSDNIRDVVKKQVKSSFYSFSILGLDYKNR